jgi:hypothetical protein
MSAIVVKTIKASKLNNQIFIDEFKKGMDATADEMLKEFKKTTKTWQHKVDFETIKDTTGGSMAVLVGTDDEIYGYVEQGTKPHKIPKTPNPAKRLAFVWGGKGSYRPATSPKWIGSRNASVSGTLRRPLQVDHPGTQAREFSAVIEKWEKPRYIRRMEQHLKIASKKSGHEVKK